jgi:hypothetical protein
MMQIAITALNSKRAYRTFFFIVSAWKRARKFINSDQMDKIA